MRLEEQVAPLALAQRMKDLGFPQNTYFAWFAMLEKSGERTGRVSRRHGRNLRGNDCAAPTVAGMGEWLPDMADSTHDERGHHGQVELRFWASLGVQNAQAYWGATEAEARARLLIALAEAGALDPKGLA